MYSGKLKAFGDETINKLIASYVQRGLRAFGEFERGLKSEVTDKNIKITAPYHARIMEDGRRAGKFPPPQEILKWVRLGKIVKRGDITDEQLAYLIGRKIAREGIKVPNKYNIGSVISSVLSDGSVQDLIDEITDMTVANISQTVLRSFRDEI